MESSFFSGRGGLSTRLLALPAVAAQAADLMAVGHGLETGLRADLVLEALDLRFVEFDDLSAGDADHVVVVLPGVEPLVPVPFVAHADPADDARRDEELEAAVDRRAGNL